MLKLQPELVVCGEAHDADTAGDGICSARPEVAIIDLSLAKGSGFDVIKRVQACCPETKLVVFSMHDEPLYIERALTAGASGYVLKVEGADRLVEAIFHVLKGETYVSALAASKAPRLTR